MAAAPVGPMGPPDYMWVSGNIVTRGTLHYYDVKDNAKKVEEYHVRLRTPVPTRRGTEMPQLVENDVDFAQPPHHTQRPPQATDRPAVFVPDDPEGICLYIRVPEMNEAMSTLSKTLQWFPFPMLWVDVSIGNVLQVAGHGATKRTESGVWASQEHMAIRSPPERQPGQIMTVFTKPGGVTIKHTEVSGKTVTEADASVIPFYIPVHHYPGPIPLALRAKDELRKGTREAFIAGVDGTIHAGVSLAGLNAAFSHIIV